MPTKNGQPTAAEKRAAAAAANNEDTPMEETAVAVRPSAELEAFDFGADAGDGFEGQTSEDYAIPFISVLQGLSPQCEDEELGARPGMLYNTVTEEVYSGKEGIEIVPVVTQHVFVEWVPRDQGGGFVGIHQIDSDVVKAAREASTEFGKFFTPEGNTLTETFYVYGLMVDEDGNEMVVVLPFTSTKISVYKKWNTRLGTFRIGGQRPPLFAHRVRVTTEKQDNTKGSFYNLVLKPAEGDMKSSLLNPKGDVFAAAKAARELVTGGNARVAYDSQEQDAGATPSAPKSDDETPF